MGLFIEVKQGKVLFDDLIKPRDISCHIVKMTLIWF